MLHSCTERCDPQSIHQLQDTFLLGTEPPPGTGTQRSATAAPKAAEARRGSRRSDAGVKKSYTR